MTQTNALRRDWTREETILALELYCMIPSAKATANNEEIIALARAIGRTANSVKLKMQNFKSCDPNYTRDGRSGLNHVSQLDRSVVKQFLSNPDALFAEAKQVKKALGIHSGK